VSGSSGPAWTFSRRRVLQGMAGLGALGATGVLAGCAPTARLSPDARPFPGAPEGEHMLPQIRHIVIYMQENHSYDSVLGTLGRGDGLTIGAGGLPVNANPGADGQAVGMHRATSTCVRSGAGQNWNATVDEVNGGAMDGFARQSPDAMSYYGADDLPFYHSLASTFVVCDRWFASVPAQTYPNRRYLQAATSVGVVRTDIQQVLDAPEAPNGTIWDRLNAHGIPWLNYAYDVPEIALFPRVLLTNGDKVRTIPDFLGDCATGNLPSVSIVSAGIDAFSEEAPQDIRRGEAFSHRIIDAVMSGPDWESTVLVFTYDEHGGFYDHVAPPPAVAPDDIPPMINVASGDRPGGFDRYGIRVPGVVVSPFARSGYVSSVVHDHTSALRLIETTWNLGALTRRDANASNLLDCLDLEHPGFPEPPALAAPGSPDAVSLCAPGPPLP
jgi:phospholipase C